MLPEDNSGVEETVDMDSTGDQDPLRQYELSQWENRILDVIMDSMRMSALSVALQCLSSLLLGEPEPHPGRHQGRHVHICLFWCPAMPLQPPSG